MKSFSPARYFLRLRLLAIVVLFLPLIPVQAGKGALINSDVAPATVTPAAEQNARLKSELNWSFGGKTQRGWYLYQPLISRLIGTDSSPESGEFAAALSRWQ